jgi:hypothetical protein
LKNPVGEPAPFELSATDEERQDPPWTDAVDLLSSCSVGM